MTISPPEFRGWPPENTVKQGVSDTPPPKFRGEMAPPKFRVLGHTPSTAGTFRKKFRKNSGKTPEMLSERFLEFLSRVRLGCLKPYNSRHLRLPERFQNSLPPSTAGDASFFRIGSGEGLSELVMEFPAVLGVFLRYGLTGEAEAGKRHRNKNYGGSKTLGLQVPCSFL